MSPAVARIVRPLFFFFGGTLVVSAAFNIFAAAKLIEPADEAMLGLTQGELTRSLAGMALLGLVFIYLGLRWTRPPLPPKAPPKL